MDGAPSMCRAHGDGLDRGVVPTPREFLGTPLNVSNSEVRRLRFREQRDTLRSHSLWQSWDQEPDLLLPFGSELFSLALQCHVMKWSTGRRDQPGSEENPDQALSGLHPSGTSASVLPLAHTWYTFDA